MRLTKDLRGNIYRNIMKGVPKTDYLAQLMPVIQGVLTENMLPEVRAVYDSEELRQRFLKGHSAELADGNQRFYVEDKQRRRDYTFYGYPMHPGARHAIVIRVDDAVVSQMPQDALDYKLSRAVIDSGLLREHVEQAALMENVGRRLKSALDSVTTTKRLFDVLEPELHQYIPRDNAGVSLPATAGPVVDDLRKLGASLPNRTEKEGE